MSAQRLVGKATADRTLRHDDDRLLDVLIVQLVERDEHQCARFSRRRRRFDQQILLAAVGKSALLHRPHAELVRLGGLTSVASDEADSRNGRCHRAAFSWCSTKAATLP